MSGLKWIPKISYGTLPTVLTLTYPQKLWTPMAQPVGGGAVSDAGIPEAFVIRRDQKCEVTIRFLESEWVAIDTWLTWGQGGNSFDFWFDKNTIGTKYTCYLDSPSLGDGDVSPDRDQFIKAFTINCTLRTTTGTRFDVRIF